MQDKFEFWEGYLAKTFEWDEFSAAFSRREGESTVRNQ